MKNSNLFKIKLKGKITALFTAITMLGLLAFSILVVSLVRGEAANQISQKVKSDLAIGNILIEASYRGEWKVIDGKLYKGNIEMNNNVILINLIEKLTGNACSIFLGDTRITTSIEENGKAILGTKAATEIVEQVLNKGQDFYGVSGVAGEEYYSSYMPIKDGKGSVLGMFEIGIPVEKAMQSANQGVYFKIFALGGVILLAIAICSYIFASTMSKRVCLLATSMGEAERGDLSQNITQECGSDELGDLAGSYNRMIKNMRNLIDEVMTTGTQVSGTSKELAQNAEQATRATEQVAGAMGELASGSSQVQGNIQTTADLLGQLNESINQINKGAQVQASSVNEASMTIGQMAHSITEVDKMAQDLSSITEETNEVANKGKEAVEKTLNEMEMIKDSVFQAAGQIKSLGEQSSHIGQIIQVIDDIADQTNLLALNAAIEAARAGEHGKGFAVVADEVRKLAERSGKATKEIAELITTIQKGTEKAVQAMEKDTQEVEIGSKLAHDAAQALAEIISMINKATEQIHKISGAADILSEGSTKAVEAIDSVAGITEENLAATDEMTTNSRQVINSVDSIFKLAEGTTETTQAVSASAQELTASSEEVAAFANKLADLSEKLKTSISVFKVK